MTHRITAPRNAVRDDATFARTICTSSACRYRGQVVLQRSGRLCIVSIQPEGGVAVSRILYELPCNEENMKSMRQAAIDKYGEPSGIDRVSGPIGNPGWCADAKPAFRGGAPTCVFSKVPNLRFSMTKMTLSDPGMHAAIQEATRKKETVKPSF